MTEFRLYPPIVARSVGEALFEDWGRGGDITTCYTVSPEQSVTAQIIAAEAGCICGLDFVKSAFLQTDTRIAVNAQREEGTCVAPGDVVARISGPAAAILTAERVALNFLGHLSGIASLTRRFVDCVQGTSARIVCTRKTTPGLRVFEKYAVLCGGGYNHRYGLDDGILIKDNHIALAGGITAALSRMDKHHRHLLFTQIEIETLAQLEELLRCPFPVHAVLFDNMSPDTLRKAVKKVKKAQRNLQTEASGGICLETAAAYAATGVEFISVGALTHSAPWLDIRLDVL